MAAGWRIGRPVNAETRRLNRVPVTAPAGAEEFAAEEEKNESKDARREEIESHDRAGVGHAEVLGEEAVEEGTDVVLHAYLFAMMMPTGRKGLRGDVRNHGFRGPALAVV